MGIKEARELFENMGITIKEDGTISKDLSRDEMDKLKEWYENTREGTVQMPTEQSFYENVLLATSLFPQQENGDINYMFGKGIGIEIALRGKVESREKNDIEFPYRSHSDFELYGMDRESDTQFTEIFGAQERYPTTTTKGLSNIEPGLMTNTAEQVDLDGITVLVPQLEILFLDKYLKQESTPREEGIDAALLAKQYDLDYGLVYKYLLEYSIKPQIKAGLQKEVPSKEKAVQQINKFLNECENIFIDDFDRSPNTEEFCEDVNDRIDTYKSMGIPKFGIPIEVYDVIMSDDLIDMGNSQYGISNGYAKNVISNLAKSYGKSLCEVIQSFRQLNDFCIENGLHSISEENLQQFENTLKEYMANEMGRDAKELNDKSIEEIAIEYFEQGDGQQKDMIEH